MCAVARESRERESGERGWEGDSVIEKVMAAGAEEGWLIRKVFVPVWWLRLEACGRSGESLLEVRLPQAQSGLDLRARMLRLLLVLVPVLVLVSNP